jgi:hypothetical protein
MAAMEDSLGVCFDQWKIAEASDLCEAEIVLALCHVMFCLL